MSHASRFSRQVWGLVGLLAFALAVAPPAEAATPAGRLEALRNAYAGAMKTIETDLQQKLSSWPDDYLKAVKTLQMAMQKAGNLDGWQDCQKEIDRFLATRSIAPESLAPESGEIRRIQDRFVGVEPRYKLEKNMSVVALAEKYIARLEALQKEFTVANQINEALAVNAEVKTVKADSRVTAAQFGLAEHQANRPAAEPPTTSTSPAAPEPAATPASPATDAHPLVPLSDEVRIYARGELPAASPSLNFKKLNLKTSPDNRLNSSLILSASMDQTTKSEDRRIEIFGKNISTKRTDISHLLRMQVRMAGSSASLTNIAIAVQYFAVDHVQAGAKAKPGLIAVKYIPLPRLSNESVTIDCPPVVSSSTVQEQKSSGKGGDEIRRGQEFCGVAITVFIAPEAPLAQFVSDRIPLDLALKRLPGRAADSTRLDQLREARNKARAAHQAKPQDPALRQAFLEARAAFRAAAPRPGDDVD